MDEPLDTVIQHMHNDVSVCIEFFTTPHVRAVSSMYLRRVINADLSDLHEPIWLVFHEEVWNS